MNKFDLFAQGESIDQVTIFGSRIKSPVELDVRTDQSVIYFNVKNNSYYPYIFEVIFGDFQNLSPRVFEKKTVISPGINRLFTFKIVDPNEPPRLSYQTRYYIANTNAIELKFKPYLIPIGKDKVVEFLTSKVAESTKIFLNQFVMNIGDTVFCSRKGIVSALPDDAAEVDRIISNSLEIRHDDGTIAVYFGLTPDIKIIKLGQNVYPGQPIGIIGSSKLLKFQIFEIQNEGKINTIDISYSGPNGETIAPQKLHGTKVTFPEVTIKKEMTKKEISKYDKKVLY